MKIADLRNNQDSKHNMVWVSVRVAIPSFLTWWTWVSLTPTLTHSHMALSL
jgi:nitrate/nitrite transporter NarK